MCDVENDEIVVLYFIVLVKISTIKNFTPRITRKSEIITPLANVFL